MRISIFGLGYVGLVSAVCLAREGHEIFGVDIHPLKVQSVRAGKSPIVEEYVEDMLSDLVRRGRIHATVVPAEAISKTQISLICVGTPSTMHGIVDLSQVENVCKQIGSALSRTSLPHTVVFRSTMLPGSTQRMAGLLSQCAARLLGEGLHVAFNPEFLREGTAVSDFYSPPYTIVGTEDSAVAATVREMYSFLSAPFVLVGTGEAELLKYASNAFHATKITFANEIGRLAKTLDVDGSLVMRLLCQDTSLNISSAYLRPGFAYGGSCLPKDLRALVWRALQGNVPVPLLESLSRSNQAQIEFAYERIAQVIRSKADTIGFLGIAFKAGTDDLRESPLVELVERLLGKGYRLLLYDENVSLARLIGANKEFVEHEIPHLAEMMADSIDHVIRASNVVVVGRPCAQYTDALRSASRDTVVINLESVLSGADRTTIHISQPSPEEER
jgi:GDP-mannose 6-dehydrogenase